MTITLVSSSDSPRKVAAPLDPRHEGPYYGEKLRRVLAPEVTDPSLIERLTDWWEALPVSTVAILSGCIIVAILSAALIVMVAR
jgi:hypothetical protein